MVTDWAAVELFPAASLTVQITSVVPNGKVAGALFVTLVTEQLSAVVGVPKTIPVALHEAFAVALTVEGATIVGALVSSTTTDCVAVELFPFPSVKVQVIV
jgi:hypothetical protein